MWQKLHLHFHLGLLFLTALILARSSLAAPDSSSAASSSSSSLSGKSDSGDQDASTSGGGVSSEVAFLQTLQAAKISSMSCLITLVNMTSQPIGTCLGLTTLSELIVNPEPNAAFSTQLDAYLGKVCGSGQCTDQALAEAKGQLGDNCDTPGKNNTLIEVLGAVIDNYQNSFHTLACSVHYNGTSDLCLPATLNTSQTANSNLFFDSLLTGTDLDSYSQSVFSQASCTGCMYEMYKAAVYTLSSIRGNSLTESFGDHLQNDCQGRGGTIDWTNVKDQQIPDALQVQQATTRPGSGSRRSVGLSTSEALMRVYLPSLIGVSVFNIGLEI